MSRRDRRRLSILVVLIAVLALTLVLGYRMNKPATTEAVQAAGAGAAAKAPTASDARIRLDIVENPDNPRDIGQKNLFQYGQRPTAATAGAAAVGTGRQGGPRTPALTQPVPVEPVRTVPMPPPPPPIALKYTGFAVLNSSMTAFVTDESGVKHYNVTAGEVLMGRYRMTQITDKAIEVEDLQYNRRQTLPLQK